MNKNCFFLSLSPLNFFLLYLQELQKWLDEAKHGFIYVSFGSMVRLETFPKKTLDIFYSSFKKISPVRVLMKIAKKEELPPGLPANVKTYHWLPQIQILSKLCKINFSLLLINFMRFQLLINVLQDGKLILIVGLQFYLKIFETK